MLLIALLLDGLSGYPGWIFRRIGHPVTWIGAVIGFAERRLNREQWPRIHRKSAGVLTILFVTAAAAAAGLLIQIAAANLPYGWIVTSIAASTLIASRSLYEHVRDVAAACETSRLESGRLAVSRIVGRDPHTLDSHGVARAAIESLAENASDGVVAPALWFAVLGLPGLAAYKAINTADSMIGHRTPRHEAFGWASARLDDLVNLPASRLTAALFTLSAFLAKASPRGAIAAVIRDARRHRSPNAGWPEAAMAGALGLKLAGPRFYGGIRVEDATMGDGRAEVAAYDIWRALRLAKIAWAIMLAGAGVCVLLTAQF
ncbi:MAG: cobalamin biosynthesis protein CobD [Rhodomicrobium sp.]|nr:cobalamin biosynthesis protein CobD [Rhodomicrobium sp.]